MSWCRFGRWDVIYSRINEDGTVLLSDEGLPNAAVLIKEESKKAETKVPFQCFRKSSTFTVFANIVHPEEEREREQRGP